ncbi:type II secretion system protein GspM [Methylocystis parvus]|uniref:General secretion pathway protein GspM n=1 Tax=Methylocystis parvus TaxID=134 RepID=A0A6B8M1F7_9HYPH|nr:type II secretion system protein GspM [Methylocystis parvus]QGM96086.1 general secretion pathway protein GspM [Methylocystis parvus]WBK00090.1 type II secretion system protein GspM [Methylocystis parvus OBBP]
MSWKRFIAGRAGRRAIFIGVNLVAFALVYLVFIEPARRMIAGGAEAIAQRRQTLARYEAVAAHEQQIQDYARQVAETNARGELLDGDSEGVINANLQARLKSIAEGAQVTVRSIQMLPEKSFQGVTLVGARLDVSGAYENIHALARALEGAPPLMIITAASLRGQSMFWGAPIAQGDPEIEAQFDVFGGAPQKGRQ